jgi:HAD superfamily hydrolase (TIGR01509 family)
VDRAIIFDVDGTLSETEETHRRAFNRAFADAGLDWQWGQALYADLLEVTGGKERIRYYIESFGGSGVAADALDAFIPTLHAAKTRHYTAMVTGGEVSLRPGIRALLEDAQAQGFRLAIATTTTPANVDALLQATLGGDEYFETICAGDSVANKKPAPDVYQLALAKLDLPAEACVAIEDSRNGLLASVAAGIATVITPGIYTSGHNFEEAALVIDDLTAIDLQEIYRLTSPVE